MIGRRFDSGANEYVDDTQPGSPPQIRSRSPTDRPTEGKGRSSKDRVEARHMSQKTNEDTLDRQMSELRE